ncbi:hypothetical protein [Streptomyces sp. NPDC058632]|uniref:hypothetical protein n=1 Tax=Streptomyces sp. NPDC058632 TaxID=3346567 RepID=UPI003652C195
MADEQDRWLDRETAERLLSGEPPEAADPAHREQAERLARALGALSAPPSSADGELPGEAAALAAFRMAREERAGRAAQDADVGLVSIGALPADRPGAERGPRWARPVRFGLAAVLTVGMVGGAAVLAGTGILPTPSGISGPAATPTATTSPERPLPPPPSEKDAPGGAMPGGGDPGKPSGDADGGTGQQDGPGAGGDEDGGAAEPGVKTGDVAAGNGRGKQIASACRALRDGRKLPGNRKRLLEDAAGGSAHVGPYCENVLAAHGTGADTGTGSGSGSTAKRDGGDGTDTGTGNGATGNGNNGTGNGGTGDATDGNSGNGKGNATGNGNANGNKNGKGAGASG